MAQIRSSRWWGGLTTALGVTYLAGVAVLMPWGPVGGAQSGHAGDDTGRAGATTEPSATLPADAPIARLAQPLTAAVLDSVGEGWTLVQYDGGRGHYRTDAERRGGEAPAAEFPTWDVPGATRLYVIDRVGSVYAGASLGENTHLEIVMWLPDHRTAIVAEPQFPGDDDVQLFSLDILTGTRSAAFDGPDFAPPYSPGGAEPSPGPSESPAEPPAPPAPAAPAGTSYYWHNPSLALAADGESLLISEGADQRRLVRVTFEGRAVEVAIPPALDGIFVEDPAGGRYVSGEQVTLSGERWVEEILSWVPYYEQRWNTVTYVAKPADDEPARVDHAAPPVGDKCAPRSWAPGRQLLVVCLGNPDLPTLVYTLAIGTSTFVRVAQIPVAPEDRFFSIKPDGTRISVGDVVYVITGDEAWRVSADEPPPTGWLWSGDLAVLWGDAGASPAPGQGAATLWFHDAYDGAVAFTLYAAPGDAGFRSAVGATD